MTTCFFRCGISLIDGDLVVNEDSGFTDRVDEGGYHHWMGTGKGCVCYTRPSMGKIDGQHGKNNPLVANTKWYSGSELAALGAPCLVGRSDIRLSFLASKIVWNIYAGLCFSLIFSAD